jgi:energy-converting hydrogenase A subunit M
MSQWIYEQDLISQKYRILIAIRQDRIIRQIAADLGVGLQELRRYIIEHCDMILLENLPARYEAALVAAGDTDPVARAVGRELYTTYIPLVPAGVMENIYRKTAAKVQSGTSFEEAVAEGRAMVKEAMHV